MSWIALRMLTGDRAKFFGIIFGVAFASLLMAQQMSIFCGIMNLTTSQIRDVSGVDLWVMDSDVLSISEFKPMVDTALHRVRSVPGVKQAVPFYKGVTTAKLRFDPIEARRRREKASLETGQQGIVSQALLPRAAHDAIGKLSADETSILQQVVLLGYDAETGLGAPANVVCGSLRRIDEPDAVIVDKYSCRLLWREERDQLKETADYERFVNRVIEVNGHRAIIVGVCDVSANFETLPIMYTTYARARRLVPRDRMLTFILVQAMPGVGMEEISRRVSTYTNYLLKARTQDQFTWDTIWYYIQRTGIPMNFGMTVGLGFFVGAAIAGQTLYQFTVENLRHFGALKAMGTSNMRIVGVTLLQSLITGPIGYGLGVGAAALFGRLTEDDPTIGFYMPWQVPVITAVAVMTICVLSALLSVRRVLVLEPAVVFRA
jgi:putative ABC transport system permease protein